MAFTKFKLLAERLLSGLGRSKTFFPFYDSQNDADYRVSLDTLITFISNELGVSSKAVFELTSVSNTGNNYVSTLDIASYKTEGLYIFKPSVDSDGLNVTTLNVNTVGILNIKEFDGTSIVDKTDLKAVNTYLLLNKTSYWLVVGGVSGGDPPVPDLSGYVTRNGNETISRNEIFTTTSDIAFGINGIISNILYISTSQTQLKITNGSKFAGLFLNTDGNDANTKATISVDTKSFEIHKITGGTMYGDIIKYNSDRTTEINAEPYGLTTRQYNDDRYIRTIIVSNDFIAENNKIYHTIGSLTITDPTPIGGLGYDVLIMSTNVVVGGVTYSIAGTYIRRRYVGGVWISYLSTGETNLGYTASPTNGIVTSDTGTDAILTLVDGTDAGLVSPSMKSTWDGKQNTITFGTGVLTALGVNTGTNGAFVIRGSSDYEVPLTFSTGLTRTSNTITNNLSTGVSGGQTLIGSTSTTSGLTVKATSGVGTTGADIIFQVGNNGATEAMRILNSGNVGIGTNAPVAQLHLSSDVTSSTRGLVIDQHSTDAASALVFYRKSRGTLLSPTTVADQDYIGVSAFASYDGASYLQSAGFGARVNGTVTTGSVPADLFFYTGSANITNAYVSGNVRMVIHSSGNIGIGTTTPQSKLDVEGGITISGGRLLFTNTFTAGGDSWYRQASNVLRAAINGTDRIELNTSGVRTKGTHTFENTIYTNLTPTVKKIGTIQTSGELTTDYTPTSFYQGIQRTLQTLVSSTTETAIFNPEIGSTLIPSTQFFLGSQWLYTIPFKLSTTGTVRFIVRFGEAATGLTSRTILADTGTFSPSVTAQGGVLKVFFTVATLGASGTANLVCNIEVQINGKNPVFTVPLRTTSSVSTLVDNLLEITCLFGTSSASDRIDVENANCLKLS